MPWSERTSMDERRRFVRSMVTGRYTLSELSRVLGISRKTAHKWWSRYQADGQSGLEDRSRAPRSCPHRTDARCEKALVEARRKHPSWGPKKLLDILASKHPEWPWPAVSTGSAILSRHGLVKPRKKKPRIDSRSKPVVETTRPNQVWTMDFKGEFRLGNRQLCYPLTIADHYSRFLFVVQEQPSTAAQGVVQALDKAFAEYGLPEAILTDAGTPFANGTSVRHLSKLRVWWIKLGIQPILIQPGRPDQNGRHERMHRTLKAETARPPKANAARQQESFDHFRKEYNQLRPHEALDMKTPAQVHRQSERCYPTKLAKVEYPGHYEVRMVRNKGEIKWRGKKLFISEVLRREPVGLEETDDGIWSVYFDQLLLGRYDERTHSFDRL